MKKKLRILVHSLYYKPEPIGIGTYTSEMCEWFVGQGHEVRVVCPPVHYPYWKVQPPYSAARYQTETIEGVEVKRCPIFIPSELKGFKRFVYSLSFVVCSFPMMFRSIFWRPDVVFVIEPSIVNAFNALMTACLSRAVALLHVQDFEVDIAFQLGLLKSPRARALVFAAESRIMRWFDFVSTISKTMVSRLQTAKHVPAANCVLFPNWVDPNFTYPMKEPSPMRKELGIPDDKIVCLFSGTLGAKQNVEILVESARRLTDRPEIEIVICGDGESVPRLKELAAGLPNVRFLPLQPLSRLNDLLNIADIHLLPQWRSAADLVMPSKLIGMVASGRPVIATVDPGTEVEAVVSQCGIVVPPEDVEALSSAILRLADDPGERSLLGEKARGIAVEKLSKDVILRGFESKLLHARGGKSDPLQSVVANEL